MKRLVAIMLCLVMCVSVLAACSGDPVDTTAPVTPSTTKKPVDNTTAPNGDDETTTPDSGDNTTEKTEDTDPEEDEPVGTPDEVEAMLPAYPEREQLALDALGAKAAGTVASDYQTVGKTPISSLSEITDPNGSYYLTADISANDTTIEKFNGVLDGCGHAITTTETLFTTFGGTILNLTIKGDITYSLESKAPLAITITTDALIFNVKNECNVTVNESSTAEGVFAGGFAIYLEGDNVRFVNCEYSGTLKNELNKAKNNRKSGGFVANIKRSTVGDDPDTPLVYFLFCTVSGNISASSHVAGLAGQIDSPATVSVYGTVLTGSVKGTFEGHMGGFLGYSSGTASATFNFVNCANNGTVKSECSGFDVGGFMGWSGTSGALSTTSFKWCANYKDISGLKNIGGFIAVIYGGANFEYCANYGKLDVKADPNKKDISETSSWSGGFVGFTKGGESMYESCVNYADITTPTRQARCGGLSGENQGVVVTMNNCANFGNITYTFDNYKSDGTTVYLGDCRVGGISAAGENSTFNVTNCVNFGNIKSSIGKNAQPTGGILGFVTPKPTSPIKLENCMNYGDIDSTGFLKDGTAVGTQTSGLIGFAFYSHHITITGCINAGAIKANSYVADFLPIALDSSAILVDDIKVENNYYVPAYTGDQLYGPFLYNANVLEEGKLVNGAVHAELSAKCTATTKLELEDSTTNGVAARMNTAAGKEVFKCVAVKMADGVSQKTCVVPASILTLIAENIVK